MKETIYTVLTIKKADGTITKTVGLQRKALDGLAGTKIRYTDLNNGDDMFFTMGKGNDRFISRVSGAVDANINIEPCIYDIKRLQQIRLMLKGKKKRDAIASYIEENDKLLKNQRKRKSKSLLYKDPRKVTRVRLPEY